MIGRMPIAPAEPPYDEPTRHQLERMMPPGVPPIGLFRTFVRNLPMAEAMSGWGRYELSRELSLSLRDREIAIDRTCARCGCEYEWGVHVAYFAEKARFDEAQLASLTFGGADDACWLDERDRLLIRVADELHERSDLGDELARAARSVFSDVELLDLFLLCGWYHALSYAANGARVELEDWAPRFADLAPT